MTVRKMVSFNDLLLQAVDAVCKAQHMKRSGLIAKALENYPDVDEVFEQIKEANKAVSNE